MMGKEYYNISKRLHLLVDVSDRIILYKFTENISRIFVDFFCFKRFEIKGRDNCGPKPHNPISNRFGSFERFPRGAVEGGVNPRRKAEMVIGGLCETLRGGQFVRKDWPNVHSYE